MADQSNYNMDYGAIAQAGAQILGASMNAAIAAQTSERDRKFNTRVRAENRKWALEDYARMLEDSSPRAQVERLKAGGLNPNLVYGSGNIQTGVVSTPRSADMPDSHVRPFQLDLASLNVLGNVLGAQLQKAQIEKTEAETKKLEADAYKATAEGNSASYDVEKKSAESKFYEDMAALDYRIKDWTESIQKDSAEIKTVEKKLNWIRFAASTGQDINIGDFENFISASNTPIYEAFKSEIESQQLSEQETSARIKSLLAGASASASQVLLNAKLGKKADADTIQTTLENNLRKSGLNPNDPVWMRMAVQLMAQWLGIELKDIPGMINK